MKYGKSHGITFVSYGSGIDISSPAYGCGFTKKEAFLSLVHREPPLPQDIRDFSLRENIWYKDALRGIAEQKVIDSFSRTDATGTYCSGRIDIH